VRHQALALQITANPPGNGVRELCEFNSAGYFYLPKPHWDATTTTGIHPIQKYHVKVDIEIERTAKVLNKSYSSSLCHRLFEPRFVS